MDALKKPGAKDLAEILREVLEAFAYLDGAPSGVPFTDWSLGCHAALPCGAGWLSLRGEKGIAERIAEDSTGVAEPGLAKDAFLELCNLACSHLASFMGLKQKDWKPFVPALGLPQGTLEASCLLDVDGLALEAAYWSAEAFAAEAQEVSETLLELKAEDKDMWGDFLGECPELLVALEHPLVEGLSGASLEVPSLLRPMHTLKGICGMLGLTDYNQLFHACEDLLQPYKAASRLPRAVAEALLKALDAMRTQCEAVSRGIDEGRLRILSCQAALSRVQEASSAPPAPGEEGSEAQAAQPEAEQDNDSSRGADNLIRIPVAKMDGLLEAVSELAICQAQVTAGVQELGLRGPLGAEAARLEKISRQLQQAVLALRMVPVQPLFTRISRQAHDLSLRMGKPLRVELEGGETEVDKGLVEELFEPLLHLVRNALDHGLETPLERQQAGKPGEGLLRLKAFHQGSTFVLQMTDDGRGLDPQAIRAKARKSGILKEGEELNEEAALELLFMPGFSTAAAVTDLSGRGVGLDAVRRKVLALKGGVGASGGPGRGAEFTLRLPLSMALMEAILVRSGDERFAVPAASVSRFLAWDPKLKHGLGDGKPWYEGGGQSLPLLDLGARGDGRAVAMHVVAGGREACLLVDEVLGKQQVVVKALGGILKDLPGLSGGAVLADGRVGLILDLESLLRQKAAA